MLCIAAAGVVTALAATGFTLSWTHSVEHTEWRESWIIEQNRLQLVEASVQGAGAGIAVPPDATWADGRWTYTPDMLPLPDLNLAASGMTPSPWTLCSSGSECLTLGTEPGAAIRLWVAETCD